VRVPLLGDTDSSRLLKYCPYGASPSPFHGLVGNEYGDQTLGIGTAPKVTLKGLKEPSVQTNVMLLALVELATDKGDPRTRELMLGLRILDLNWLEAGDSSHVGSWLGDLLLMTIV
jgi:hypothetical protein